MRLFCAPRRLSGWSLLALLSWLALGPAAAAQTADVDPPVIRVLESGADLVDGSLFNRTVTPFIEVTDASPVIVDSLLDGVAFVSGTPVTGQGLHEIAVSATDAAGNAASLTVQFEIDLTPPVFGDVLPADGSLTAAAEVTLAGEVVGADSVTVDGQAATLAGGQFTAGPFPLAEGEHPFALVASDAAGNTTSATHRVVRDATPPAVAISQPLAGVVVSAPALDVVGSVSDLHLAGGGVTVNGTATNLNAGVFAAPGVPLAEGDNVLTVVATDGAGNVAQTQRTVNLDTLPPTVAVTDPAAGAVVPDAVLPVSGTATDPHLDRVEVDGVTAQVTGQAWTAAVPLLEGPNTLTVTAFDVLGHGAQATVSVIRDSQAPEIRITQPADASYWNAATVDVDGTVVEEPGLTVTVNGQPATLGAGTFSLPAVPLVEGENRLIARVTDALGNQGAHTRVVYRDTVAPELLAGEPGVGALAIPPDTRFVLTFSEPLAPPVAGSWSLETAAGVPLGATATPGGTEGEELVIQPDAPLPSKTEVHLVLGAGLVDRAGNPLAATGARVYTVADVEAPGVPVLSAAPPAFLCAPTLSLSGSAEAEAVVEVAGAASRTTVRAAADGSFTLGVELQPGLNHLEITAEDRDGNRSAAVTADVVHDCEPPVVIASELIGDQVTADLNEPADPASALAAGVVTVSSASGAVAGSVTMSPGDAGVIFTATDPLPAEPLRLAITTGLRDRAGNPLAFPFAAVFGGDVTSSFLAGRVIDADTGRPLAGARVVVTMTDGVPNPDPVPEATTGADGRFRIPVAAGTHFLQASRPGYSPAFRIAVASAGIGADVFDPRLSPAASVVAVDTAGGTVTGNGAGGSGATEGPSPTLEIPAGALSSAVNASLTALEEQSLPALLPYGWSPRGAAWLDLGAGGGTTLLTPATLSLPVDAPDGLTLPVARLDLGTLQWWVVGLAPVIDGRVEVSIDSAGAYVAVEADTGPPAPPAAVTGAVLGSAAAPTGDEVLSAQLSFDPEVVLPSQRSRVTATYSLLGEAASGLPLTLSIREELTLLDGTLRNQPPYEADFVLYRDDLGSPRSRFGLRPSEEARDTPLEMGAEDVTVRPYGGVTVAGNVLGPVGGTVTTPEGDRVDVGPGALAEPVPVTLTRRAEADLPAALPAGTVFLGFLSLDLSGVELAAPAALSLELGAAPAAGEKGLLFELVDLGAGALFRPVADLAATASGWTTAAIDPLDLPWPGVRRGGQYVFARLTADVGYLRGSVWDIDGTLLPGARIGADTAPWIQLSGSGDVEGRYVLPVPLGALTAVAENLASHNQATVTTDVPLAEARVDADFFLLTTGPVLLGVNPPDGSVDITPGVEPTLTFSEAVDSTTVAAGIQLYQGSNAVAVDLEPLGALVRIRPKATLTPGTYYEIRVNTALRDLQGVRLAAAVTSSFITLTVPDSSSLDLGRIHLFEPDGAGMAAVQGRSGAVPAGSLVFVENTSRFTSTVSVTAAADGSFDLTLEAGLDDTLLLHVLIDGANEVLLELTPFLTADGRGAHVTDGALSFTTLDDITVRVEAGTFRQPAVVRVVPQAVNASPAPVPSDFQVLTAFELDFGGAEALRPVQISLPTPAGTTGEGPFLLSRTYRILGEPYWMLYDLMRLDGARLTTEIPPEEATAGATSVPPGTADSGLAPAAGASLESLGAGARMGDLKEYLPGSANPGLYTVMESASLLDFVGLPFIPGQWAYFLQHGMDGMVAAINQSVTRLLQHDAVLIATRRSQSFTLVGRDFATGYQIVEATFDPPPPDTLQVLAQDPFGDSAAPIPVGGSPLRFLPFVAAEGSHEIAAGITGSLTAGQLTLTGQPGAAHGEVEVQLVGLDDAVAGSAITLWNGSFIFSSPATVGNRYLLVVSAIVKASEPLELVFSEMPAAGFPGIHVADWADRDAAPRIEPGGALRVVEITPEVGWQQGKSYTLTLDPGLVDASGNSWGKRLDLGFRVEASKVLSTLTFTEVRDIARLGSLLFVAAGPDGLVVVDASSPAGPKNLIPDGYTFRFPQDDPVMGVAVDSHGRVIVVGGGVNNFGQLKIFDPLALDPAAVAAASPTDLATRWAAFKGSTLLSDKLGGTGSSLPEGTPRRVSVLTDDDTQTWRFGIDPVPAGLAVDPPAPPQGVTAYTITLSGSGWTANRPVTFRDLTRGRLARVDTDSAGAFSLALDVEIGDRLELRRNQSTLAYVATRGVGIQVVDVNAFYNETPEDPSTPTIQSDVIGTYTGFDDPTLELCQQPVSDIGGALLDLGALLDTSENHPHPLTLVGLVGFRGLALFDSDLASPGDLSFFNQECLVIEGSGQVGGLTVIEDYPFDLDGNGVTEETELHDYIIVAHRTKGVLIYDAEDRDNLDLVGRIQVPGNPSKVEVDRARRRLLVSAAGAGIYVIDFNQPPSPSPVDANGDAVDDRLLETIVLPGNTNAPALLVPELGLAWAGGLDRGLTGISLGAPRLNAVVLTDETSEGAATQPRFEPVGRLSPLGVPVKAGEPGVTASFRVLASLPAWVADPDGNGVDDPLRLEVAGMGPGGLPIAAAGDPLEAPGIPEPVLPAVELRRLATHRWEEGHQLFLSDEVVALADLRAAQQYTRTTKENEQCRRCDGAALGVDANAREVLSGFTVSAGPDATLRQALSGVYGELALDGARLELASVPWELSPAVRQEPTQNPSLGIGDVAPGTLLHSGEMTLAATDLFVRGRGLDFAFLRTHRSQTVGSGPLGPGWDHIYHQRLRELPTGDVEYYDGRGRRETFEVRADGSFQAPPGRFAELVARGDGEGWVLLTRHRAQLRFDGWGRLIAWADAVKDSADTGNEMRFLYDAASRLVEVVDSLDRLITFDYTPEGRLASLTDFTGRTVTYGYDASGRLTSMTSPKILTGTSVFPDGLTTGYTYTESVAINGLASWLNGRDNVASVTDPKGQQWLDLVYSDVDFDGYSDEVTGEGWGEGSLSINYDFTSRSTVVTDRRGNVCTYQLDAAGHTLEMTDPTFAVTSFTYDADGSVTSQTEPLGRMTTWSYDTETGGRSRGNATEITVIADSRGGNGSDATVTTAITYDLSTNHPAWIVNPRLATIQIGRADSGLPLDIWEPEGRTTQLEYNSFGQPTKVTNPNGHVTTFDYFDNGASRGYLRRTVVDPGGLNLTTRFETDSRGNITAVIDPRGVRHEQVWNEVDWKIEATRAATGSTDGAPALGYTTVWVHDANGNVAEARQPFDTDGASTTSDFFTYGVLDELLQTTRQVGGTVPDVVEAYSYDANLNPVRMVEPSGQVTQITYDPRNLPETVTSGVDTPETVTEAFAYDADRQPTTVTDGRLNAWATTYDGYGRVQEQQDPLGNRTSVRYDNNGNRILMQSLEATTGRLLTSGAWDYDLLDRPTTSKQTLWVYQVGEAGLPQDARDLITTSVYDPASNITSVTDAEGRVTTFQYDAAERRTEVLDPAGNRMLYDLDAAGNPTGLQTFEKTAQGGTVVVAETMGFDALGREISHTDALGNTVRTVYDARDLARLQIDAEGFLTVHDYDGLDRKTKTTRPEEISETFEYDPSSRLTAYVDAAGHRTAYAYDALNRRTSITYPDQTTYTYSYDASHNVETIHDPNGNSITQTWDAAKRMTARTVTLGAGVVGPTSESFTYDGLDRLTQAVSGTVVTDLTYDSLSRQLSEKTAGKTVAYQYDDVGNVTEVVYSSGKRLARAFDELDRPLAIGTPIGAPPALTIDAEAIYQYRGPYLLARKDLQNGIVLNRTFDAARRKLTETGVNPGGKKVFDEVLSWNPRSLKSGQLRRDQNSSGQLFGYDGAGRLLASATAFRPSLPTNTQFDATALAGLPSSFEFTYDASQNLVSSTVKAFGIPRKTSMPADASGRNRPGSIGGVALAYDANGNLTRKGDQHFQYDYRNRLTRVTNGLGVEVASYTYDAFNRRVEKSLPGVTLDTVWSGWRAIEEYEDGILSRRRSHGAGLDEIVREELDLDGDGLLEPGYVPLYDSIGNLVALTDLDGDVFERTRYSPYGLGSIRVDATAPNLEQILFRNGAFRVGFSEEVSTLALETTIDAGGIRIEQFDPNQPELPPQDLGPIEVTPLQIEICSVELGCGPVGGSSTAPPLASLAGAAVSRDISSNLRSAGASRWVTLSLVNPPADGTHVRLTIAAGALEDLFQNRSTQEVVRELTWGTQDTVLLDDTPPRVRSVRLSEGHLEIELTEEPDLASAQAAIDVGQPATWALSADGLTLRTETPLLAGGFTLTVQPSLADQAGLLLQQLFELSLQIPAIEPNAVFFEEPDPQETQSSSVGNVYGFHGLPRDPETGLIYARNRYYDPETGRFVTADPLGYVDGPSMYGFAGYDTVNQSDPSGLICHECTKEATKKYEAERRLRERWYNSQTFKGAIVLAQQMEAAGVSVDDAQVALSNFFRLRGVSFQDRVPLIQVLTGTGQGGVNRVLSELEGIHVWADFFESYLLNYPLAITGAEVALGARAMIIAIRQVGVRAAIREVGAALRPVAWDAEVSGTEALVSYDARFAAQQMGLDVERFASLPPLRQEYVTNVVSIRYRVPGMREAGMTSEQIARTVHAERRALGVKYKEMTPPELREFFYNRNFQQYGDRLGPTIEWLKARGDTWEQIIESASRPGGGDLGF